MAATEPAPFEEPIPDRGLNPFNYSITELTKTLVALVGFIGFAALVFITFDPSLIQAVQLLVPAAAAVVLAFASTNTTPADINKALQSLLAAVVTVVSYFEEVPASTVNKIAMALGALVTVYGIYRLRNQG